MNDTNTPGDRYTVNVARDPDFGICGDCWVARDSAGVWRSYCAARFATTAAAAVVAMFHRVEIGRVVDHGETAAAEILC